MNTHASEILPMSSIAASEKFLPDGTIVPYDLTMYELDRAEAGHSIAAQLCKLGCNCYVTSQHEFEADYYYLSGEQRFRVSFILEFPRSQEHEVRERIEAWLRTYDFSDSDLSRRRTPPAGRHYARTG